MAETVEHCPTCTAGLLVPHCPSVNYHPKPCPWKQCPRCRSYGVPNGRWHTSTSDERQPRR